MKKSFGFIGGGRVVKIILNALKNNNMLPEEIIVSDINTSVLEKLKTEFPTIVITNNNIIPAKCNFVFLSLHPPVVLSTLDSIKEEVKDDTVIISLAPKITIKKIQEVIGRNIDVVRMIPNAATFNNKGFNPVVFSDNFNKSLKDDLLNLFNIFGKTPIVDENKLESYAIITAMGPTYLWFQLIELIKLGKEFNLTDDELKEGITEMVNGTLYTLFNSGLTFEEVLDLIPVKPLGENEETIKEIYNKNLRNLFAKLKN
jgi:pyrroline-5-carboxylate reductase